MTKFNGQDSSRSLRLSSRGRASEVGYFVTVCVKGRRCVLGSVVKGSVRLTPPGSAVERAWRNIPERFPQVSLDEYVVMPERVHGIIVIGRRAGFAGIVEDTPRINGGLKVIRRMSAVSPEAGLLRVIVDSFKSVSGKTVRRAFDPSFAWEPEDDELAIRDESDLACAREYIFNDPLQWGADEMNT